MKWIVPILVLILLILQVKLWVGDGSLAEVHRLNVAIEQQKQKNTRLHERNQALEAEVKDLKQGLEAVEERARSELGMIRKDNETFYQVVEE